MTLKEEQWPTLPNLNLKFRLFTFLKDSLDLDERGLKYLSSAPFTVLAIFIFEITVEAK